MRLRLMATYLGVPYQAGLGPDGTDVTLFSPGPPPEELGFTASGGYWRKQVGVMDLDALWQSRPVGEYRGEPCLVLDDPRSVALVSEPVRIAGEVAGRVTSGGYGYTVGRSVGPRFCSCWPSRCCSPVYSERSSERSRPTCCT